MLNFKKLQKGYLICLIYYFLFQGMVFNSDACWKFFYSYSKMFRPDQLNLHARFRFVPDDLSESRILICGNSQGVTAIDYKFFNEHFSSKNISFYPLSSAGGGPIELFLLRKKIFSKKPDAIIFMSSNITLFLSKPAGIHFYEKLKPEFRLEIIPLFIKHIGLKKIFNERKWAQIFDAAIASKISLFFQYNPGLRTIPERLLGALILDNEKNWLVVDHKNRWQYRKYWNESDPKKNSESNMEKMAAQDMQNVEFDPATPFLSLHKETFVRFVTEAQQKGIKIIVINIPPAPSAKEFWISKYPGLKLLYDHGGNIHEMLSKEHGFLFLSEKELPEFYDEDFADAIGHQSEKGVKKFTDFLVNYLENGILNEKI